MADRRISAALVTAVSAFIWGCASEPRLPSPSAGSAERSARGNPPFYEVLGKRYYVMPASDGYVERGVASWYGKDFHRLPTSSGEPYDMYAMTAAHKTLPLPTWVEVTNLENGRKVIVKVNDRGPFVGERIIDLSFAAAEAIDMVNAGTARVEVRALAAPGADATVASTLRPASSGRAVQAVAGRVAAPSSRGGMSAAAPALSPTERLFIQVGAFSDRTNAQRLVDELRGTGFDNAFVFSDATDALHRVRLGPFDSVDDYDRANDGLRRRGVGDTRLVVGP